MSGALHDKNAYVKNEFTKDRKKWGQFWKTTEEIRETPRRYDIGVPKDSGKNRDVSF